MVGVAVHVERHVAHDADDLQLAPSSGDALADDAVCGTSGKACRAKFALTTARPGAVESSRLSKPRPARTGTWRAARAAPLMTRCCIANLLRSTGVPARGPLRMCVFQG